MLEETAVPRLFGASSTVVLPIRPDKAGFRPRDAAQSRHGVLHAWTGEFEYELRGKAKRRANDYPDLIWFACITTLVLMLLVFVAIATM